MAKKDKYLVGLDIGSTKTCALIAEIDDDRTRFLALGAAESKGLRKGLIVNLDALLRVSSNPFYPYVIDRIEQIIR